MSFNNSHKRRSNNVATFLQKGKSIIMDANVNSLKDFTVEALVRAMVPIENVIKQYKNEWNIHYTKKNIVSEEYCSLASWTSSESQEYFANIILSISKPEATSDEGCKDEDFRNIHFLPSSRYLKKLVLRFVSGIEREGFVVEDSKLSEVLFSYLVSSKSSTAETSLLMPSKIDDGVPNPMQSCYVSFAIPSKFNCDRFAESYIQSPQKNDSLIGIRVFPFHNDVGIRKVWEAGCCLAEFFLEYPYYIQNKHILELGAGVGHTGMIIAACCGAKSVHMTDYTDATLSNLEHNLQINSLFLESRHVSLDSVTWVSSLLISMIIHVYYILLH